MLPNISLSFKKIKNQNFFRVTAIIFLDYKKKNGEIKEIINIIN